MGCARNGRLTPSPPAGGGAHFYYFTTLSEWLYRVEVAVCIGLVSSLVAVLLLLLVAWNLVYSHASSRVPRYCVFAVLLPLLLLLGLPCLHAATVFELAARGPVRAGVPVAARKTELFRARPARSRVLPAKKNC